MRTREAGMTRTEKIQILFIALSILLFLFSQIPMGSLSLERYAEIQKPVFGNTSGPAPATKTPSEFSKIESDRRTEPVILAAFN
jgi:hypothetical protein